MFDPPIPGLVFARTPRQLSFSDQRLNVKNRINKNCNMRTAFICGTLWRTVFALTILTGFQMSDGKRQKRQMKNCTACILEQWAKSSHPKQPRRNGLFHHHRSDHSIHPIYPSSRRHLRYGAQLRQLASHGLNAANRTHGSIQVQRLFNLENWKGPRLSD